MVGRDQKNEEYEAPEIVDLGPIEDVTFGNTGSGTDVEATSFSSPSL